MSVDKITQTKDIKTFVDRAKSFCTFLETHQSDNYKLFISDIQKQPIELYTFARTLPDFDFPDSDIEEVDIIDDDIRNLLLQGTGCVTRFIGLYLPRHTTTTLHQYAETW